MGNKVLIDHLEVYSNKISGLAADAQASVKSSMDSFDGMSSGWQGKSYQAFSKSYSNLMNHLNQIPKAMTEVSCAISTIASNYQKADNEEDNPK